MSQRLFALPILPGKTEQARAFMRALAGERKEEFAACERWLGATKEIWTIQSGPQGDLLICYWAVADGDQGGNTFVTSKEAFDVWFNAQLGEITGPGWSGRTANEILADYEA